MIKSTKAEREAVIARLKDALKTIKDSELQSTLNALEDLNALEEQVVAMCEQYEKSIVEDYRINHMGQHGPTFDNFKIQNEFFLKFNALEEFCRNHHRVQRAMRSTDSAIAQLSQGNKAVVRGRGITYSGIRRSGISNASQVAPPTQSVPSTPNGTILTTPPKSAPNNQVGGMQQASPACSQCGMTGTHLNQGVCLSCQLGSVLNGSKQAPQQLPNPKSPGVTLCNRCGKPTYNAGTCDTCLQKLLHQASINTQSVASRCQKCNKAPCEKGSTFCFNCNNTSCNICSNVIGALPNSPYCSHCKQHVRGCTKCGKDFVSKKSSVYSGPMSHKINPMFSDSDTLCQLCHDNCSNKPSITSKIMGFVNKSLDDVL